MEDHRASHSENTEVFKTRDGATLVGQLFRPEGSPRAAMLLNGATGVPQDYYRHFAAYAAQVHDLVVMTYDYRDMARSAQSHVRGSTARMSDWGIADQEAARAKLRRHYPGLPLWVLGHSLGGMTLPLQADTTDIARVITVASGNVRHTDHPWPYRALALMFWFGAGPIATAALGYMPGKLLGLGADVPSPAYWQWRRWCTSRDTFGGETGRILPSVRWKNPQTEVKLIAFEDDDVIPPKCVALLAENYGRNKSDITILKPQTFGLREIGHIGAFARRNRAVWDSILM